MKFIKYLILSACFFISTAWAGEGVFVELTSGVGVTPWTFNLTPGVGIGYKYNSSDENYFGYFQGSLNVNVLAFALGLSSDEIKNTSGVFDVEYGYEFRREQSFSYGVSISPLVFMIRLYENPSSRFEYESESEESKPDENNLLDNIHFVSFLGVFGKYKINDSFFISIEGKGLIMGWDYFINTLSKGEDVKMQYALHPLFPVPVIEVKGAYFF